MYLTYVDLPPVPKYIRDQIIHIVEHPIHNFQNSASFVEYARKNLNIEASQEIIDAIVGIEYNSQDSLGYHLSDAFKYFDDLANFDFLEVNDEIKKWVRENIDLDVIHISIQSMHSGKTITPHIDEMRNYAYNYIIETGGDKTSTCFWTPKVEYSHLKTYAQTVFPYDRLDLVEKIKIKECAWHKLDTKTIHSVENLDPHKKRISLSLSFL
jgi:hypothetical protein